MKVLGIDIGGSGIKGAPVDVKKGKLVGERHRIPTPQPATPEACAAVVKEIVKHFNWKGPIGCAIPARVKRDVARTATNIDKGWLGLNVAKLIKKKTGCPAYALNDADAAGVAEMAFGQGRGRDDLVLMLTVGTGIGSALFWKGHLVPNSEFGHIDVLGHNGELYASDRTRQIEDLDWSEWATRFQHYLERIEFLIAPDLILIGGGISRPKRARQYLHLLKTEAELVPAELQNEAGIIGAAYRARKL